MTKKAIKLLLLEPRGFCAGVVRAIDTVKKALSLWGPPIYVKHQIVHNRHVVQELEGKGAIFIEDLCEVPLGARVIYSAHGIPPSVRAQAKKRQLIEIDASCGLVIRVHSAVKRFAAKGYHIVLIGHKKHVEVIGTAGHALGQTTIVESVADVQALCFSPDQKLCYVTQTTLSLDDVREIANALKQKYPQIQTMPSSSICYATTNRQLALKSVTKRADLVLVIGDPLSSNSNRLCEVARGEGVVAHLVHDPADIAETWLENGQTVAVTAGASTPESVVTACLDKLGSLACIEVENVTYRKEEVFFQLPRQVLQENSSR